jgi:hypothetical protein
MALGRLLVGAALGLPVLAVLVPSDASASVSIAIGFEALCKDADNVAIVTPGEARSVWEDGRIYTYTRVHVDRAVAGDLGAGADGFVRTMGGVVGNVGQMVDGEPVLNGGRPSLLFLRKLAAGGGAYEVSARAQGQYPILYDEVKKAQKLMRSANVGMLVPPKPVVPASGLQTQSKATMELTKVQVRLAQEVMNDRPLDDAVREIAAAWRRLHSPPAK